MSDYDPQKDGAGSYYAAIAAKRARGDDYYLRQPDDPGVEDAGEPLHRRERSLSCRLIALIAALVVIEVAAIAAFIWLFGWL